MVDIVLCRYFTLSYCTLVILFGLIKVAKLQPTLFLMDYMSFLPNVSINISCYEE